ncbi:MAG: hypothetical protein ACYDH5_06080 [Acidimicrobiales bacterium]
MFGPNAATYRSNPNWAYIWGEQQAYGAYKERTQGVWAPYTKGGTLFADIETTPNLMCGSNHQYSGWLLGNTAYDQQQNTNVIQGFMAEARKLSGNPPGLYWNPNTFNQITAVGIWPRQVNAYAYWQAGGCSPITSYCHVTTTSSLSNAQQQYVGARCSENVDNQADNLMVLWQYDLSYDFDTSSQQAWTESGDWFRPGLNGC